MNLRKNASGISESTAQARLQEEGPNELPHAESRGFWRLVLEVLKEPMVLLLAACGGLYSLIGEPGEAGMLLVSLFLMAFLTLYQAMRSERSLLRLRDLSAPRALVVRDGVPRRIAGTEVVREDCVILNEGDRVPADGVLDEGDTLRVDESLLTGESSPVVKDRNEPRVYAGTLVVQGNGCMRVERTGSSSELGRIGHALIQPSVAGTLLQKEVRRLVRVIFGVALILSAFLAAIYGVSRHDPPGGLLLGLSLAMAILPNEIPAVLAIFFSMGASRMARFGVISRNPAAVENLGRVTVLCADKTGTLTLNQMTVDTLWTSSGKWRRSERDFAAMPLPESVHEVMEYAVLASREGSIEPMEVALHHLAGSSLQETEHLHPDWEAAREYPIGSGWMMSRAWKGDLEDRRVIAAKGAPEAVLPLCTLESASRLEVLEKVKEMAESGLRVIAVAKAHLKNDPLPERQDQIRFEFVGLLGLKDPLRAEARDFVRECERLGVRVVMMTGDHPATALSIARELGITEGAEVMTGEELQKITDSELSVKLDRIRVYSRVKPEQKLRLVELYQAKGEAVAMTGDGVNDAPALKRADVGIAMGARGTDVAREAADLVLVHDDFGSILNAIRLGRLMRANLRNAFRYLLSIHIPVIGLSILPVFFRLPLILMPVHIAFLHLWVEPISSIAFEGEPKELRGAPSSGVSPRDRDLFDLRTLGETLFRGSRILAALLLVFIFAWFRGKGEWDTRGLAFTTLLFANFGLLLLPVLQNSSRKRIWLAFGAATLCSYFLILQFPVARVLLRVNPLHPVDLVVCALFGVIFALAPVRALFRPV